ncbi:MAG: family 10 glycosylhydrolase [Bacteroidales bacterium]|nr:family 10 glycosylhydrolase [Bacteroidales bacterium]
MRHFGLILLFLGLINWACSEDNGGETPVEPEEVMISEFTFKDYTPEINAKIDEDKLLITAQVPHDADLKSLVPTIIINEGATVTPPSGYAYDFTNDLTFKVTLGDQTKTYSTKITNQLSSANDILSFSVPQYNEETTINQNSVTLQLAYGVDLTQVAPEIKVSDLATISPASGETVDLSEDVTYTVTAENGEIKEYTVTAIVSEQEVAVRAFWIPDPSHTNFLRSYDDLVKGVALADELNFNVLYVCAWAKSYTLYPSQVLADNSSHSTPEEGLFHSYTGGTGDPLQDLITEAHAKDIKVILWYEYGFMSRWGSEPTPDNDKLLAVHPDWVGINNEGEASNYNGTDFYYNAYNPEVQQFMLDLIMEAVNNYDIDGVQGDDRLPAMPRNSGYDTYTANKYKAEKGVDPPSDYNNADWVRFRADILNEFALTFYNTVKAAKPDCIVGFSPNPYPWAFNNLMQEWPMWLDNNLVQILSVQCYRNSVWAYEATIDEVLNYFNNHGDGNLQRLSPGLILKGSSGLADPEVLRGQMQANRDRGIMGESFFYDVPLGNDNFKEVIKSFYKGKARLPEL